MKTLKHSGTCDWCKDLFESLQFCSSCRIARYCSPKCQESHWKKHYKVCVNTSGQPLMKTSQTKTIELSNLVTAISGIIFTALPKSPLFAHYRIIEKETQGNKNVNIYMGNEFSSSEYARSEFDLSDKAHSVQSWHRLAAMEYGRHITRGIALLLTKLMITKTVDITLDGHSVKSILLYKAKSTLPLWNVVWPDNIQEPTKQNPEHIWIGLRMDRGLEGEMFEDVYFLDFTSIAFGLENTHRTDQRFCMHGWSHDVRCNSPQLYRSGSIHKSDDFMNRWSLVFEELCTLKRDPVNHQIDREHMFLKFYFALAERTVSSLTH